MILSASNFLDLVKSNKKLSECKLPELIHKLIRQSLNGNTYTRFPSGDDVFTPGWVISRIIQSLIDFCLLVKFL